MIRAVVFDFDGVIADSIHAAFGVTNKCLGIFGKSSVTMEEFREEFGADWKKFYRNKGCTEHEIDREPGIFKKEMGLLKRDIEMFRGIDSIVHQLMESCKLGIVSNNYADFIVEFLQKFGIHDHFSSIIGFMPDTLKPDTKQLLLCLDELGVRPEEACLIGDTEDEIIMGRRANVGSIIAVSYGYQPEHKLKGADVIVHSPEEILATVNSMVRGG